MKYELGRFTKSEDECISDRDRLFYIFQHSGLFREFPNEFKDKPFLNELLEACEIAAFPKDKKLLYNTELMNEIDILSQRKYAQELGYAEGYEEGGERKAKDAAKNLLAAGIAPEVIASCVGLSVKDVTSLIEQ